MPLSHSSNLLNIVPILSFSNTLGATQLTVSSALIWSIEPFTKLRAMAFMIMNSTWPRGMPQVSASFWKVMTLLFLGRLNASSKNAINLIFCSSCLELLARMSWINIEVRVWAKSCRILWYPLCWIFQSARKARHAGCSSEKSEEVVLATLRSCRSDLKPELRQPYRRED